jgi:predicted nucleic acid-binding protein
VIVVVDTSVLNYLIRMKRVELLRTLYGRVVVADAVREEMLAKQAPADVRRWALEPESWVEWASAMVAVSALPERLGPGERETIEIALKLGDCEVLMDDQPGRRAAEAVGLHVSGTIAVLLQASRAGLLEFDTAMRELQELGFRMSDQLIAAARRLSSSD